MGIAKYITNFEELAELLSDGVTISPNVTTGDFEEMLANYFRQCINLLSEIIGRKYYHRVMSFRRAIPALQADFVIDHTFDRSVVLTGIAYSQTVRKREDCWSFYAEDKQIFKKIFTKEIGEHKFFNAPLMISEGGTIKIVCHNASGNSKHVWYDLEYGVFGDNEILHDYDIKIVLRWESRSPADIDIHLMFDNGLHLYYANSTIEVDENTMAWLDHDYTIHMGVNDREDAPEIVTILGRPSETAEIYVQNYNSQPLTEPVTVTVFDRNAAMEEYTISAEDLSLHSEMVFVSYLTL